MPPAITNWKSITALRIKCPRDSTWKIRDS